MAKRKRNPLHSSDPPHPSTPPERPWNAFAGDPGDAGPRPDMARDRLNEGAHAQWPAEQPGFPSEHAQPPAPDAKPANAPPPADENPDSSDARTRAYYHRRST